MVVALVVASCGGDPAGSLESATAETRAVLEETAGTLFPSHSYTVDVTDPWGLNCTKRDGTDDLSRESVIQDLGFDLEAGDDPLAMAGQVVEYWEGLGFDVSWHDFGDGRMAGSAYVDEGRIYGFSARSLDFPGRLRLSATTGCYSKE